MNTTATQANTPPRQLATVTKYFRTYRWYFLAGLAVTVLSSGLMMYTPRLVGQIIDGLEQGRGAGYAGRRVLILVGLTAASGVFMFLMRRTVIWASRYIETDLRGEMFSHLLRLTPSYYHGTRTGDVMAAMTNDLEAIRMMAGPGVMYT
ncbi:MAG TPA: ABC transporter transmembrane domain-containing protein, partial [candidate division Zixibacteria bacterium]|nr:ABC transporter transmembrane domain-containing protein [candidate division Zixibacteria bacterium]